MIENPSVASDHHDEAIDNLSTIGPSHADVSERLLMEFGPTHGLGLVSEVLRRCRIELAAAPAPTSPTALERLARTMIAAAPVLRTRAS